jgi:hypothetical protein
VPGCVTELAVSTVYRECSSERVTAVLARRATDFSRAHDSKRGMGMLKVGLELGIGISAVQRVLGAS